MNKLERIEKRKNNGKSETWRSGEAEEFLRVQWESATPNSLGVE